jgi:hypothetical protein
MPPVLLIMKTVVAADVLVGPPVGRDWFDDRQQHSHSPQSIKTAPQISIPSIM